MCSVDRRRLDDFLAIHFLRGTPCTGLVAEIGYFGLVFKDDNARVGVRMNTNLKKRIAVFDPSTQPARLVQIFESVILCAAWFQVVPSSISCDMRTNRKRQGLVIRRVADLEPGVVPDAPAVPVTSQPPGPIRVRVPRTGQWCKKQVEEVDAHTGEVSDTFDSVKDAAAAACVQAPRMTTCISKSTKIGNFFYRFVKAPDAATTSSAPSPA